MNSSFLAITIVSLLSVTAFSRELQRNRPDEFHSKVVGDIWSNCSRSDDIMQIEFVKISPDDIKENSDIHVFVKYILKSDVTDGTVSISLTGVPIRENIDICDALGEIGSSCPLKRGPGVFNVTQTIPELGIPKITITGKVTATDQDNNEILCVKLNLTLHE